MNLSDPVVRRLEDYLREVEKNLAHKSPAVRRELLEQLRAHALEGLRRQGGENPGVGEVERVLADMDAPECFADSPALAAPAVPEPSRPARSRWFRLLPVLLAFVLGYGVAVWRTPRPAPAGDPAADVEAVEEEDALALLRVEQVNLNAAREATLRLVFNAAPNRESLTRLLRLSVKHDPDLAYTVLGQAGSNVVLIKTATLALDQVDLHLAPGLVVNTPGFQPGVEQSVTLTIQRDFHFQQMSAESPAFSACALQVTFNAMPEVHELARYFTVEPPVKFTAERLEWWQGSGVSLVGDFQPGALYTVTVSGELASESGTALGDPVTRTVQFPNRPPALSFAREGRYLSPRGRLLVPVSVMNVDGFTARLAPVFPNNLVQLAQRDAGSIAYYGDLEANLVGEERTLSNTVSAALNQSLEHRIDLRALAGSEPRGVYWMSVEHPKAGWEGRLIVVTDLGLAARVAPEGVLVWVNSLRDARPVAGAEVVLYGANNQEIARARTDTRGLVLLPRAPADQPLVVTAQKEGDLSYLDLSRTRVAQGEGLEGAPYLGEEDLEAAVFSERGVYRPGEKVFLQALVRDRRMQAPPPFPVLFRVRRPDGRLFQDVPVTLDGYGSVQTNVTLPDFLPTGRYGLELALPGTFTVLGRTEVALEDFVPPQIRVDLQAPAERLAAGSTLVYRVQSEHLFGRASSGLKVTGLVTFRPADFRPPAWPGWSFGDPEKSFAPVYRHLGTNVLDEEGRAIFSAQPSTAWRPPSALLAVSQAVVTESSGRTVSSYGSTPVDVYPFYIGLRLDRAGTVRVGETQRVSVVEVWPDGRAVDAGKPLLVSLARVQWNSVLARNSSGGYAWKSEREVTVLQEDTLAAGGEARAWPFAVDRTGEYLVQVADPASGSSSSLGFTAASADQEWVAWSRERPDRVELSLDREGYRPGDTARLLVKAPFAGTALVTVESDRVLEQRVITLEKNTAELELAVRPDYAPNVHCVVSVIRPAAAESVWSAHRAVGAIPLPVEPAGHRLQVALDAPATNRPQSALPVRVSVRDEQGRPAAGAVTVMAVDEAICTLTDYETPDPLKVFLARRGLGVDLFDLYSELMPVIEDTVTGASPIGGDGMDGLRRRLNPIKSNRFKPVALWQAAVELDEKGQAVVELPVPEFTGALRLMAVAYNGSQSGVARQPVKVKRALVVQPSLPRFLATGDRCTALVDVFNESGQDVAVALLVTCGGPLQVDVAEQPVALKAGEARQVQVPLRAAAVPGQALCTFEVTGGAEAYRETVELAVRPASGLQVATRFAPVKAGETLEVAAPAEWVPASVAQDIVVSGQPALQLGPALEYVMRYPYGCLEQTVSGAFPLLHAADLAARILPGSMQPGDVSDYLQAAILRVLSMQQGDGRFALWPLERAADTFASLYATHFLVEARKAGFPVPAERVEAALGWLAERLDQKVVTEVDGEGQAWADDMQERAYACHILALAGRPNPGWNARLREQADRLGFAARVHVACALLLSGEPRLATALLGPLGLPAARPRETGGLLNSEVRDAALLLLAWLEVDPQHEAVPRLAKLIEQRQQDGRWANTQDNAMALLALGQYARRVPVDDRPFTATLTLPDGAVRTVDHTAEANLHVGPGEGGVVRIHNQGPGTLYLAVRSEGVSTAPEAEQDTGLKVRRAFLDLRGRPVKVEALPQGEFVIVQLEVETGGRALDNLVITELLPAGWEIENPNLATAQQFDWITEKSDGCRARDLRDDRLLLFTGAVEGRKVFYYAARAVTPGAFGYPPVTAACMYDPEIRSVSGGQAVEVHR